MSVEDELSAAIEGLYLAFAKYNVGHVIEGCPCCVSDQDQRGLAGPPLRALTSDDLARFAFKAMTTWGDEDDFRHFLPRIFELVSPHYPMSERLLVDEQVVFGKLNYGNWRTWPDAEQAAIRTYLLSAWQFVATRPHSADCNDWLESLTYVDPQLALEGLAVWEELTPDAATQLSQFLRYNGVGITVGSFSWGWATNHQLVANWLNESGIIDRLFKVWDTNPNHPDSDEWAAALEELSWEQSN